MVDDEGLQDAQGPRLFAGAPIFHRAGQGRNVREAMLSEKPGDFQIGIESFFDAAKDLEDQPLAEHHRAVALLGLDQLGRERFGNVASQSRKRRGLPGRQLAGALRTVRWTHRTVQAESSKNRHRPRDHTARPTVERAIATRPQRRSAGGLLVGTSSAAESGRSRWPLLQTPTRPISAVHQERGRLHPRPSAFESSGLWRRTSAASQSSRPALPRCRTLVTTRDYQIPVPSGRKSDRGRRARRQGQTRRSRFIHGRFLVEAASAGRSRS